jgi:dTDP-4-dehydrorhamnose reductase
MERILITGANGLLGSYIYKFLKNKKYKVIKFAKNETNLLNKKESNKFFFKNKFSIILNLAAITNIDQCEKFNKKALSVNTNFLKNIRFYSGLHNKKCYLIHLSTDQFYSKYKSNFEKQKKSLNFYTKTKLLSEIYLENTNSIVLRTNFFGKSLNLERKSFTDFIYYNLINKEKINLVDDVKFSPLSIESLSRVLLLIIKKKITGIYNIGSKKGYSKFEFGMKFAEKLNLDKSLITKVSLNNLKLVAKRPKDMRMKVDLFEKKFNFKFETLDNEILKVIKDYEKKN